MITQFKKVGTDDLVIGKLQDNTEEIFVQILSKRILDGVLLEGVVLTTSAILVPHPLKKPVTGYIVVRSNANSVVYDQETSNTLKELFVKLLASATATVSLWVF